MQDSRKKFMSNTPNKFLVVGASGFVGKVLCKQLHAEGTHVRALIRKTQKGDWNEAVVCDLENFQQHEKKIFHDIDTVFYLASIAHNKAPETAYQKINVDLCLEFAEAALANGVKRFVYVSSTKAMAEPNHHVIDETFADKPKDKYGLSKRHAEEGLLALSKNKETGFEHLAIVRPCLIYGAGVQGNLYLMMSVLDKDVAPALPETKARRSMISVNDVARALVAVAKNPRAHRQIYILTDGQQYPVKQLEQAMRRQLGKGKPRWQIPGFVFALAKNLPVMSEMIEKLSCSALYSSDKIESELGWHPIQTFNDVLPDMVDDYRLGVN
jgi:nucleoside-diphosphate-sugar epimerase